ncbi:hypothetical protein [Spirillospora sp. CA-128828]|uniref:hypothetical protein n=1 Tax=Spirillospora sp. CA-128828 TaxID=3240033 RepID=UPI003D9305CE
MSKRRSHRRGPRIPDRVRQGIINDGPADPVELERVLTDVDTEIAALLSDDPALGPSLGDTRWPLALFEPRRGVGMVHPDGSLQEMQTEAIIQAGFSRWRQLTVFEPLPGWSVRQTPTGLELWDKGGIWARGRLQLPARWRATAEEVGSVIAVYGHQVGVRPPETGSWTAADRSAELHRSVHAGLVAVGLVTWRGLEVPDKVTYPGPRYDPDTGQFPIGQGAGNTDVPWQLNTPGEGVRHGVIIGERDTGKTNVVRIITVETVCSDRFRVWLADPQGRHNMVETFGQVPAVEQIAESPGETLLLLRAAAHQIDQDLSDAHRYGGPTDPSPDRPGLIIVIDEAQEVFAANPEATRLAEHIVTRGGPAGVGLIVTTRGADLAYFGGSATLRAGLAAHNRMAFGTGNSTLDVLDQLPRQQGGNA